MDIWKIKHNRWVAWVQPSTLSKKEFRDSWEKIKDSKEKCKKLNRTSDSRLNKIRRSRNNSLSSETEYLQTIKRARLWRKRSRSCFKKTLASLTKSEMHKRTLGCLMLSNQKPSKNWLSTNEEYNRTMQKTKASEEKCKG